MLQQSTLRHLRAALKEAPAEMLALPGATSSELYRLSLSEQDVVLRLFLAERWEASPAALSRRELSLLSALATTDIPAPAPLAGLPDNGVVMSFLPGSVELPAHPDGPWLDMVARMLARIHACGATVPFTYESWNDSTGQPPPDWWPDIDLWQQVQGVTAATPDYAPTFIHRDYHPVNLLWEGGHISGVVDWINACMGPRGIDVAHCRLNLALMYGQDAADAFRRAYVTAAPAYSHDPYWDLDDALGALPDVVPYPPWAEFGLTGLSTALVRSRLLDFVRSAVQGAGSG